MRAGTRRGDSRPESWIRLGIRGAGGRSWPSFFLLVCYHAWGDLNTVWFGNFTINIIIKLLTLHYKPFLGVVGAFCLLFLPVLALFFFSFLSLSELMKASEQGKDLSGPVGKLLLLFVLLFSISFGIFAARTLKTENRDYEEE